MIEQMLNRDFLEQRLRRIADLCDRVVVKGEAPPEFEDAIEKAGMKREEVMPVLEDLRRAAKELASSRSTPLEKRAFIGRDATVSLIQSVLDDHFEIDVPGNVRPGAEGEGAIEGEVPVTDRVLTPEGAQEDEEEEGRGLLEKFFEKTDSTYVTAWVAAVAYRKIHGQHAFNPRPADRVTLGDKARIVLLGDWATGIPRAIQVSDQIRRILKADEGRIEQHVVHLGDVYYVGWPNEYKTRFLRYWPVHEGEEALAASWCLNGNHDMYSGGRGYFALLDDPRFAHQQKSSFFSLASTHWLLLGLDSSYEEFVLHGPQSEWAVEQLCSSDRANIVMTHHQPFSGYEKVDPRLLRQLKPAIDQGKVRAWFWGHEHRCSLYAPRDGVHYGRCVGHGGVPVYVDSVNLPDTVIYTFRESFKHFVETWARLGFAVLDFDGPVIEVRYVDETGRTAHQETLIAHD
jgi:hypothetical protein